MTCFYDYTHIFWIINFWNQTLLISTHCSCCYFSTFIMLFEANSCSEPYLIWSISDIDNRGDSISDPKNLVAIGGFQKIFSKEILTNHPPLSVFVWHHSQLSPSGAMMPVIGCGFLQQHWGRVEKKLLKVVDSTEHCWKLTLVVTLGKMVGYNREFYFAWKLH